MSDPSPNTSPPDQFIPMDRDPIDMEFKRLHDRIDELEEWIDTIVNPKSESGHCFFCQHRIGRSVFAPLTADPAYHEDDCIWMKRQSPGANKWGEA